MGKTMKEWGELEAARRKERDEANKNPSGGTWKDRRRPKAEEKAGPAKKKDVGGRDAGKGTG